MNTRSVAALGLAAWTWASTPLADGEEWRQKAKLLAADRAEGDYFGTRIALSGDVALIAARLDDDHGSSSGSVYAFDLFDGVWSQSAKLTPDDGASYDYFGASIAFRKGVAIIGAYGDDDRERDTGSAYIFELVYGAWIQTAKLTAADAQRDDGFGRAVGLFGETALVGAPDDDNDGYSLGSAYIFERIDGVWVQTAKLTADDGANWDQFGSTVALSGDTALIGAHYHDDGATSSGSVYVFEKLNGRWTQTDELKAEDRKSDALFGYSIALEGDTALIGAYRDDGPRINSGAAYVFERKGGKWSQAAKLTAADAGEGDYFGWSVALLDGATLVGAPDNDGRRPESGSAYRFERVNGEWVQTDKLSPADGQKNGGFGGSVALAEDTALIGAGGDGERGIWSGAVYVFDPLPPPACTGNERIAHVQCRSHSGVNRLTVALRGGSGSPADTCTVALSEGRSEWVRLSSRGKARVKFMEVAEGSGTATVTWGCGATAEEPFACGDPLGWQKGPRLTADDGAASDEFGVSVAVSGATALVGAFGDDDRGRDAGSAYVFENIDGAWSQTAKLLAPDGAQDDRLGADVALAGDTALIGAYRDDDHGTDSGSVYVFERAGGGWTQTAKLTASDATSSDYFGISIAMFDDAALIGAYSGNNGRGAAYVFEKTDGVWQEIAVLKAADGSGSDHFGLSVALSGHIAIVGAPDKDTRGRNSGSAYVFENLGGVWTQVGKLTLDERERDARFGSSVAVSNGIAFVGAPSDDMGWYNVGSVSVFEKVNGSWRQTDKLTRADARGNAYFGASIAMLGDTALIGAPYDDNRRTNSGAAYMYRNVSGVWSQTNMFTSDARYKNCGFGESVALSEFTALVGAPKDGSKTFRPGTAYLFERTTPPDCTGEERIVAADCTQRDGVIEVIVQLAGGGGAPRDTYTVTLSSGEHRSGTLSEDGTAKVRIQGVAPAEGTAAVVWGCGTTADKKYACP